MAAASTAAAHGWHFAAAAAFLIGGLVAAAVADARDSASRPVRRRPVAAAKWPQFGCVTAMLGAAAVHVYVIPEHFEESALYGAFFIALAAAQLGWAALVAVRPTRRALTAGIAANASVVLLWLMTRLVAVPVGPGAGTREEVGALDVFATSCELAVIVIAALLLARAQTFLRATCLALDEPEVP